MQRARGVDRILDIIECVARLNRLATRSEIAGATQMPRSTVYSLCDTLVERRWLEDLNGQLRLGPQAGFVSNSYLLGRSFESLAREVLRDLTRSTETLTELNVVEDWLHIVALSEGHFANGYIRPIEGARIPLAPTAAARMLLAGLPEDFVMSHLSEDDLRSVTGEPVSRKEFFADIRTSSNRGYATIPGWFDGTLSTLAVPVWDAKKRVIASLCMILPTRNMEQRLDYYLSALRASAADLTALLDRVPWAYAEQCWRKMQPDYNAQTRDHGLRSI